VAGFGDEDVVFNTHAEILFRNVDTGFHGDDHARGWKGAQWSPASWTFRPM